MCKPVEQAGETPVHGRDTIKTAESMWTKRFLCVLQAVAPLIQWMCEMSLHNAENLQVSGQVIQNTIPNEIFQRIKLGMHGNNFKLVEQRTESLLQAGSSGSPGGEQVGNLAAGSDAQALGGLTKQNFHGAGHAQC